MSDSAPQRQGSARILVVDDDEGLALLMADALGAEGFVVEVAATGQRALQWLVSNTADLVVLDLKLADVDAPAMIAGLDRVPFIVVTGQGDERVAVDVMKRGALDYVMKDGSMLDLLPAIVRRALENTARERALAAARAEHARLEREVVAASERERHAIGADLHDGLGQLLTAVEFMCTALKEDTAQQPEIAVRLDQMGAMLREAIAQTRYLSKGLVPIGDGPEALQQGLSSLTDRTNALGRVHCEFECDEPVEISNPEVTSHLFRIAQEAVNNAVKHARAITIVVRLMRRPGWLVVEVEDDGNGLKPESEGKGAGLGLMRYRASLIGADLSVKPRRGGSGVVVTCSWPQLT